VNSYRLPSGARRCTQALPSPACPVGPDTISTPASRSPAAAANRTGELLPPGSGSTAPRIRAMFLPEPVWGGSRAALGCPAPGHRLDPPRTPDRGASPTRIGQVPSPNQDAVLPEPVWGGRCARRGSSNSAAGCTDRCGRRVVCGWLTGRSGISRRRPAGSRRRLGGRQRLASDRRLHARGRRHSRRRHVPTESGTADYEPGNGLAKRFTAVGIA